jgi:hypothetical protein
MGGLQAAWNNPRDPGRTQGGTISYGRRQQQQQQQQQLRRGVVQIFFFFQASRKRGRPLRPTMELRADIFTDESLGERPHPLAFIGK